MMASPRIRCRPIAPDDLDAVADVLTRGFPLRPRAYWVRGLARMAARRVPDGYPRFGFLLQHEEAVVGVLLMIAQEVVHEDAPAVRCNLSSWTVDPAFRSHAALLGMVPFRYKAATLVNVSAAPNTWDTIEAQGFRRYTVGQRVAVPLLGPHVPGLRVATFEDGDDLPEADLLADHAALGCLAVVGRGPEGPVPFVFLPARMRQGRWRFPGAHLVFCRTPDDLRRFARPLGRYLARRGLMTVILDEEPGHEPALPGLYLPERARKYVRGPATPRRGDLAYTEFTIFGA